MSAVTASIIVGTRHRSDPGVQPRWLVLLHEGRGFAWHLLRLQLSGPIVNHGPEDPPGVLWQGSSGENLLGDLSLLLHLHAARTPEIVSAARDCKHLQEHRVDLASLEGAELSAADHARQLASGRGRELMLSATILPGSRLTEEALLELPDWEISVSHVAISREWSNLDGTLVTTDYRDTPDWPSAEDDNDEWAGEPGSDASPGEGGAQPGPVKASTPAGLASEDSRPHRRFGGRRDRPGNDTQPRTGLADLFGPRD